jgi:HD-GYP domain-containing protein (c-di-GMP phosphodiesterase class II)
MLSTLKSMAKILDARDPHTSQHSTRVTNFSMAIANILGPCAEDKGHLYIASSSATTSGRWASRTGSS